MSIRISFSTGTFYHRSAAYSLALARDAGFDGVELVLGHEYLLFGTDPARAASEKLGVPILSVHQPFFPFPGWPRSARRAVPRLTHAARALGAELSVVHTVNITTAQSLSGQRFVTALSRGQQAALGKLRITLENSQYTRRPARYLLDDLHALAVFAREHDCGITFDTCHAGANGENLLDSAAILRDGLINIHLSDAIMGQEKPITHLMPGEGNLPLRDFLAALARDGYDGLVTMELHPSQTGLIGRKHALERLAQARDFVAAAIHAGETAGVRSEPECDASPA